MLFNEPKLLNHAVGNHHIPLNFGFSALQRAEIAERICGGIVAVEQVGFSALQRAEIAETRSSGTVR